MNWDAFTLFLEINRLAPHFAILAKRLPVVFPEEVKQKLKNARYDNLLYGDKCKLQVQQVLKALANASIPVIVLKGWAVIQWLYGGDHGQRFCEDIDILVPLPFKEAAENVLQEEGYKAVNEVDPGFLDRFSNAKAYVKKGEQPTRWRQFSIGFHWGLTHFPFYDRSRLNTSQLFERRLPLLIAGVESAELSLEDQLIYTCAHLALHHRNEETLLHYFEIAMLLRRAGADLDWPMVLSRAREWGYLAQLRVVILTVHSLWNQVLDLQLAESLDQISIPWKERVLDHLVAGVKGNRIRGALVTVLALPGFGNKLRAVGHHLFPSRKYMEQRYKKERGSLIHLYWLRISGAFLTLLRRKGK